MFGKVAVVTGIFDKRPLHLANWLEQVIISPYYYCLNYFNGGPDNFIITYPRTLGYADGMNEKEHILVNLGQI